MDLILWRHADSKQSDSPNSDSDRDLSSVGLKHARQAAEWILQQPLRDPIVLSGSSRRTIQTAQSLGLPFKIKLQLDVGATTAGLLAAADWPDHPGTIILVSHQPALGRLASLLLAGTEADWTIKKAGVWWFTNRVRRDETQTVLRAVHNP